MDWSVAQEFQSKGITEAVISDYTSKHQDGLCLLLAGTIVICYDYLLTVHDEFTYIWGVKPRVTFTKGLFFFNRYLPLVTCLARTIFYLLDEASADDRKVIRYSLMLGADCVLSCPYLIILRFTSWSGVVCFATVELVLMTRVWLLYDRSKRMGIFLALVFVSGLSIGLLVKSYSPESALPLVTPFPDSLTRCPRSKPGSIFWLYTIAIIVEGAGFILLLWKAYTVWYEYAIYTPFITSLIKQGGLYYCIIFGVAALMTISTVTPKIYLPLVDAAIVVPICSVTSNRLVLSLRERWTLNRTDEKTLSMHSTTITSPQVSFDTTTSTTHESTTFHSFT